MAFRQAARKTEAFDVQWDDQFAAIPWTEDKTDDITAFLLSTGTKSFAEVEECSDGTPADARLYVTRALKYMTGKPDADVGYAASSLIYDTATRKIIAICLCCGPSVYLIEVHPDYQRQGIATRMLKHALTVCAEHNVDEFNLWRNDDSIGVPLYAKLGFQLTGEVE